MLLKSLVVAVLAWLFEAALDAFVFHSGPWHARLFPLNDTNEIWHRLETITFLLIFSLYSHAVMAKRKRLEAERAQSLLREQEYRQVAAHKAELERSNAELAQFASVVAHDLRSPLSSIAGFSELLERHSADHLDAKATRYITGIMDGVKRMQALIEGVLAYAQVGAQGPPLEPIDCAVVVERAVANLHAAIAERGALVTHTDLPTVAADATQLSQVFQNLIGNAIKYCRETPRVTISADREGAEWQFSVRDNGIGMDAADAERIFDIFQRAHAAAEYPGTGIGLAICKKTIERHGGRICAESCVGQGTTFKFTLPAREARA
jgi:light-regulated signal transduction histidine kinase (bacteriophytochrome)